MIPSSSIVLPLRVVSLLALSACIETDCVIVPCAQPLALSIRVSSAINGGPVSNAVAQITGGITATIPCLGSPTTCLAPGSAGTYTVTISAPGFQSVTQTVTVKGKEPEKCGCGTVEAAHLDIGLMTN
ncbi:MAG: PEGA domain-containing protein [Gemmatimonadaceae bacterium]